VIGLLVIVAIQDAQYITFGLARCLEIASCEAFDLERPPVTRLQDSSAILRHRVCK
jgi:hypothetical protein